LDYGIGVQFVTKGAIPDRFFDLFSQHPSLIAGQIGLTTLDAALNSAIEPHAAPAYRRLKDLGRLAEIGVTASLRADPLIYGVTDHDTGLDQMFSEVSSRGIRDVTVSYLFLRPAIVGSLKRNIHNGDLLAQIIKPFGKAQAPAIRGKGTGGATQLPLEIRRANIERIRTIGDRHNLRFKVCGCKNADVTSSKCHLTNLTATAKAKRGASHQESMW